MLTTSPPDLFQVYYMVSCALQWLQQHRCWEELSRYLVLQKYNELTVNEKKYNELNNADIPGDC